MKFIQYFEPRYELALAERGVWKIKFDFCSLNEFKRHPHIQYYIRDPNFKRFTICRDKEYELISELKDGKTYKIGILDGNLSEIPEWNPEGTDKEKMK